MQIEDLEKVVAEMRRLGVKEYKSGDVHVILGEAPVQYDEKSEEDQQRIRDEREKALLRRQRRVLLAASSRIGPAEDPIK